MYNYNSTRGNCQFIHNRGSGQILRGDNISTYFYIQVGLLFWEQYKIYAVLYVQPEFYGELEGGDLRIARVPSFYQNCDAEQGLAGCLVKYDNPSQQCSEGRSG